MSDAEDIRVYLERLKVALGVRSDEKLAESLGYSKQTIASWRKRGRVSADAELKIIDAFGPNMAFTGSLREIATIREDETVHAVALFAYEQFLKRVDGTPSLRERRSIGYLYPRLASAIRTELRKHGFEQETSLTMIEQLIAVVASGKLPEVAKLINRALDQTAA